MNARAAIPLWGTLVQGLFVALFMMVANPVGTAEAATAKAGKPLNAGNGAIAFHRASGAYGFSTGRVNAREARIEALRQCNNSGNINECEVVLALSRNCGALASHKKTYFAARGATREEAEAKARRICGVKCEILVWACT